MRMLLLSPEIPKTPWPRIATSDDVGAVAAKMTSLKNKGREKCTTNEK
jgi:hypothetical protein